MQKNIRLILASSIGNILENYDYILYANFAFVISGLFFPSESSYASMLAAFSIFAAGFFMRPIGAIIFGYIGDKYSRKTAFSSSIIIMSIATSLIGVLPSFSEIGIMAPILLTILRLLQGLSIGGETSGYMTYLMESAPNSKRKSLLGSFALSSTAIGLFLAFLAVFISNFYFSSNESAWRIAFLISLPVSLIGIYIRFKLEEGPEFNKLKQEKLLSNNPLRELFKNYKKRFLIICGLFISISIPFYIFFAFLSFFLAKESGYSQVQISIIYLTCTFIFAAISPISGMLSDKFGNYKILLISITLFALLLFPIFTLIFSTNFLTTLGGSVLFILSITMYQASIPVTILKIFPVKIRSIGTALSFNIVAAIFGGLSPLVLTYFLIKNFGYYVIPAYLIFSCTITIISLICAKKSDLI